jgi:hypothetical protein
LGLYILALIIFPSEILTFKFLDDIPPTTRRAVVFVRRLGANGLGHIGWAFEWNNGWFNTGSVENKTNNPFAKPEEMGFWTAHTLDPIATMRRQNSTYDEFKLFHISQPLPKEAWRTAIWESWQPYYALRHNCNDVVYDILRAFGASELVEPAEQHVPNDWFDALLGPSYKIAEHPIIPLRLHKMSQRELATGLFTSQKWPQQEANRLQGVSITSAHLTRHIGDAEEIKQGQQETFEHGQDARSIALAHLTVVLAASVTSRLQWRRFSIAQCWRTNASRCSAEACPGERAVSP